MPRKKARHKIIGVFARKLKSLRLARRLTQGDLARMAGLSVSYYGRLETGRVSATLETIGSISDALRVNPAEFLMPEAGWTESLEGIRQQLREHIEDILKNADRSTLDALTLVAGAVKRNA